MSVAESPKSPSASLNFKVIKRESWEEVGEYSILENSISGLLGKFSGGLIQEKLRKTNPKIM
jgi:hypothetical protein